MNSSIGSILIETLLVTKLKYEYLKSRVKSVKTLNKINDKTTHAVIPPQAAATVSLVLNMTLSSSIAATVLSDMFPNSDSLCSKIEAIELLEPVNIPHVDHLSR